MADLPRAGGRILAARARVPRAHAVLVAVSGIDGSGKGWVADRLSAELRARGLVVATINVDGWLRLPSERFSDLDPGRHFYDRALRLEEMIAELALPLRQHRSVRLTFDRATETAASYRREEVTYEDVDIILLEGIFLFKRGLRPRYDLAIWISCTFATALERAVARAQEGLSPEATIQAYERIYFPAQCVHLDIDAPIQSADLIVVNDPRI